MKEPLDRRGYVYTVLAAYLELPDTPARCRPPDRALAQQLFVRRIPLRTVSQALLLATARRNLRPPTAPALRPIRSLYYFLPLIEELLQAPLSDGYSRYLKQKLAE